MEVEMSRGAERSSSDLPVIPDPYEESLTPQVPGLSAIAEFEPLTHDRADIAKEADKVINGHKPIPSIITGNGSYPTR